MTKTLQRLLATSGLALLASFAAQANEMADGEVRKIDQEAGKVTLKHGEIKHLNMPGMTMVFTVKEKTLLDKLKAGDKVKFAVVQEGSRYVITEIKLAP
jgi:Cu(I)/Ag(I) efflux system periplasmic protein CusF